MPVDDYKRTTADIVMLGVEFEMKSPIGKSRTTIGRQIERAARQSKYIIVDGRRTELDDDLIVKRIRYELGKRRSIKRVIYISSFSEVLEIID
jgi:hypothetical protein